MNNKHFDTIRLIGLNIAYYRKLNGISQIELAVKINIIRTHMSRIETALCEPPLHVLLDIAEALNIDIKDLLDLKK
jgi:transcriptional regulator with XRE-family HTH domain